MKFYVEHEIYQNPKTEGDTSPLKTTKCRIIGK